MSDDIKTRVSAAERDIDQYFDSELKIAGLYRPALVDAMLDVAEQLVTGHRAPDDKHKDSIRALYINVIGGLNWSLRRAHELATRSRRPVPGNIDRIAHDCISDGMMYPFVQDAFYSYWKHHATVSFPKDKEILFAPTGGELDARLRSHHGLDGIDEPVRPPEKTSPLLDFESPFPARFVNSMMKRSVVKQKGGYVWKVDRDVIKAVADVMTGFIASRLESAEIEVEGLSMSGLVRGAGVVIAVSQIHTLVSIILSDDPTDISTSVNWPALFRHKQEWLRWFGLVNADERVLSTLTFDFDDKYGDVAITPLVPIDGEFLGVVPSVVLRANWPRNLLALFARKFGDAYSAYSASKEDRLLTALREAQGSRVRGTKVRLPEWKGRRLPDIDLVVGDDDEEHIIVAEVKWQLSASETRDVIARDEYLMKGSEQLMRIRDFLTENPAYLQERRILQRALRPETVIYMLLCKGHMGSEDVIKPGIVIADWDVFCDYIGRFPVGEAVRRLSDYDYLPVVGRDFTVDVTRLQFGEWVLGWKQFHAPELPPDNETEALEALYRSAYKFLPRDR